MSRRYRIFAVATVAATAALVAPPPATAMSVCQVKPLFGFIEGNQVVAVAGVYNAPAGAIDTQLSCGVVVNGATYAVIPDKVPGPVAVLAGTAQVPNGSVSSCYEVTVRYLDGAVTHTDTCP